MPEGPLSEIASDWSADGNSILYFVNEAETSHDIWYLKRNEDGGFEPVPFLKTPYSERIGKFSPDGQALTSGQSPWLFSETLG